VAREAQPIHYRIVLNAGMVDNLLGCSGAEDVTSALDRARDAIDSGEALKRLMSHELHKIIS
jgi:anthranilate phosphoribosyltransferase